jgi:hypothetical protein
VRRGAHRFNLARAIAKVLHRADPEQGAVLPRGEEGCGRIGQGGGGQDVAGLGRRVGVHGGDVKCEQLLHIGMVEFVLRDGHRHGTAH